MSDEATRDAVHGNRLNDLKKCLTDEEYYVDVNQPDEHQWTYLMYAVRYAFDDIVTYLLDQGADIHAVKGDGNAVIHIAAREGHLGTLKLLLSHGADPTRRNKWGILPSLLARQQGHNECEAILNEAASDYHERMAAAAEAKRKAEEAALSAKEAAEKERRERIIREQAEMYSVRKS
jgi:ankyrin repeat protein